MSFFDTISRIIQQGKEMAVKATPSSTVTYNKVTPVDNSQFQSNPLLRDKPLQYQAPVIQQPTFNVPVKAEVPLADTKLAITTPEKTNQTMAQTVSEIIQGGKESVRLGGNLAKEVGQGTARTVATALITAGNAPTQLVNKVSGGNQPTPFQREIDPRQGGIFSRIILGDTTVKDLPTYGKAGVRAVNEMTGSNIPENSYTGIPFAIGGLALDLSGTGKAAKKTLEKVASNMTAEDATLLRNLYARPTAKDVLPVARNEQAIINALKLDKLPYAEQKKAVSNILQAYEKRWGGVDEALNPPVKPNRAGAMDVKKPNVLDKTVLKKSEPLEVEAKKYKSAEEFVKAQKPLYHGTTAEFDKFDVKKAGSNTGAPNTLGTFFAENTKDVESFRKTLEKGFGLMGTQTRDTKNFKVIDRYISPNAKLFDLNFTGKGIKMKDAETLAEFIGNEKGEILTPMQAKMYIDELIDDASIGYGLKDQLFEQGDNFKQFLVEKGYVGYIDNMGSGSKEYVIFDPEKDLVSKSQLEDIWKQANEKQKPNKMADYREGKPNRTGAMDMKKPNVLDKTVLAKTDDASDPKKYKSAEEFVKAQPKIYHGTPEKFDEFDTNVTGDGAIWFTESVDEIRANKTGGVSKTGQKLNEMERVVKPNTKLATPQIEEKMNGSDDLIANGYRGVVYPAGEYGDFTHTKLFFPNEDTITLTQLEDIYNKANAKPAPVTTKQKPNKMADYRAGKPNSEGGYIQNPLAGKGETPKSNNQVVSSGNDSTRLSLIDKLIADNKVRVVSRDGRDVYQVKKGDTWVNKRDEDSAIRAVTPRSPIDVIKKTKAPKFASDATEQRVLAAEIAKEALDADPARQLTRFIAKRGEFKGQLPEVTGRQANKTGVNLDVRAPDLGYENSEEARKAYDAYRIKKVEVDDELRAAKLARQTELRAKPVAPVQPKVRQMSRSRDVAWLEREATDRVLREQKRVEKQLSPAFRSVLDEPTPLNKETVAQLEKAAMPTADVVRPSTPYKAESLANVITKTPLDRKVNIIDYLRTPDRVLNKIGFGKEAKLLRDQYEKYSVELPKNIDKISEWVKRAPDKDASTRIFQYLDGKAIKLSATEKKVADEIRAYLKDWADRLGLPEENRVANYITRLFDDQLIKQEFDEDLAKIISGKIPGEVYNPFLQKRLGAKGYKQDVWGALDAYTKRATRKVHLDPALDRIREKAGSSLDFTQLEESQFKYIQRYIDRVQMRPTEVDNAIDNAVKQTLGYRFGQRPVTTVSRFLRRMTYRGMLGANLGSALRNLSQGVNTYAVLGEKYTAIGYAKLLQPASQRELIEQGIFNNNFIEDRVLSSTKKLLQKGDKALWFFFDRAEKINRGSAYLGAKAKGLGKGMSEQQAIDYAKNIVRKTQFSYDAVDQPVALGSDIMKTMFQFQTYTTKQAEFLTEMVKDKNVVGLLRYAIGGYLFVNTVGKALGMEESELVPLWDTITGERKFSPAPSLKFPIELTKAIADTPDRYGNDRDLEQKAKDVGKSLIGLIPGGIQIKKTYEGYKASQEGGSFDKAGRKQFEVGDSKASQLQAILFGKYANQNAKDYFNKETNTGNKELDETIKDSKEKEKNRSKDAEAMLVSLKSLPPDRANAVMKELKINDEAMFNKVKALKQAEDLNWSKEEKAIANLGVTDGTKARYVYSQVNKLGTAEEKNAYLKELLDRKIISKEVLKQIKDLKEGGKNNDIIE